MRQPLAEGESERERVSVWSDTWLRTNVEFSRWKKDGPIDQIARKEGKGLTGCLTAALRG